MSINGTVRIVSFGFQQPVVRPTTSRRISLWSDTSDQEFIDRGLQKSKEDEDDGGTGEENHPQHEHASILKLPKPRSRLQTFVDNLGYTRLRRTYFGLFRQIAQSWRKIMLLYETLYEELQFPIFSEKAGTINQLSGQLWLLTFSLQDFKAELTEPPNAHAKDDVVKLNELYAKVVYEAVLTEEFVQNLLSPLKTMADIGTARLGEMKRAIFGSEENGAPGSRPLLGTIDIDPSTSAKRISVMMRKGVEGARVKSQNVTIPKSIRESLLRGSRIQRDFVFDRLAIYTRTTAKRKWDLLNSLSYERRLQLVTDALLAVTSSLVKLRRLLKPILRFLTDSTSRSCSLLRRSSVVAALDSMAKALTVISPLAETGGGPCKYADFFAVDEPKVITVLRRTEAYVYAIVNTGKFAVTQLMEVMAMAQLCYVQLLDGLQLPIRPCYEVVKRVVKNCEPNAVAVLKGMQQFQAEDFLMTRYPDVLRKVPVIIHRTELSLQ